MYYYSASTNSFYHSEINKLMPDDAVHIPDGLHRTLMSELEKGKQLSSDNGFPIAIDKVKVNDWQTIRTERNVKLKRTDYTQLRDFTGNTEAWATYRQELRDIPQTFSDPNMVVWPVAPQ